MYSQASPERVQDNIVKLGLRPIDVFRKIQTCLAGTVIYKDITGGMCQLIRINKESEMYLKIFKSFKSQSTRERLYRFELALSTASYFDPTWGKY
jgi:hypothetical protein